MATYENGKLKLDHLEPVHATRGQSIAGPDSARNLSVATNGGRQYSTGGDRRMSQWDALKVAKAGGVEIDEEIELLEEELRNNPVKPSMFSPVINFKDPRHFTYVTAPLPLKTPETDTGPAGFL